MIQTFVAWLLLLLILLAAYGWSAWLTSLLPNEASRVHVIALTVALSIGALTQIMFWLSLVNVKLDAEVVTIVYGLAMLPGWWLWRGRPLTPTLALALAASPSRREGRQKNQDVPMRQTQLAIALLLAIGAAILFNAAYWPFSRDDAVGIYDAQAQ